MEEVNFSEEELHLSPDGASILSYMQKIYPGKLNTNDKIITFSFLFFSAVILYKPFLSCLIAEWKNFLERLGPKATNEEIRYWASFRGQTLSRTGIRYHHFIFLLCQKHYPCMLKL